MESETVLLYLTMGTLEGTYTIFHKVFSVSIIYFVQYFFLFQSDSTFLIKYFLFFCSFFLFCFNQISFCFCVCFGKFGSKAVGSEYPRNGCPTDSLLNLSKELQKKEEFS